MVLEHLEAGFREADQARLRTTLGDKAFDARYQDGRNLPPDAAITLALEEAPRI